MAYSQKYLSTGEATGSAQSGLQKILLININNDVILCVAAHKMVVPFVAGSSIAMIAD